MSPATTGDRRVATVLVVDDEPWNLMLVESMLDDKGHRVLTAASGAEALDLVAGTSIDAVLLDVMMPGMDGYEVCRRLKSSRRTYFIPVIMLTVLADTESKIEGLEAGADDFLNKPINRIELLTRVSSLLRIRALRGELDSVRSVIYSMVTALEHKAALTRDHSLRVAALVAATIDRLRLAGPDHESLIWAALLHDVGKVGVPEEVLMMPPDLRSLEAHRLFQLHPLYGERILKPLKSLRAALPIIRHHHERLDGSGYPDGLEGSAFTPSTQVVAAANAYELFRMESPHASPATWAAQLRAEAAAGKFHRDLVEGIVEAAAELPELLPELIDLLPVPTPATDGKILVADDSATNRGIYEEHLCAAGYQVRTYADGRALLDALAEEEPDLVLADVKMPGVGGEEICRRLRANPRYEYLPVILATAEVEATSKERALTHGADEFLSVPVNRQELIARVRSLLRLRTYHADLEQSESVVLSFAGVIEAKDPAIGGHSVRVGDLAAQLARQMGLPEETAAEMKTAGLLHDIGKVGIPEEILHKSVLTKAEIEVLMTHPLIGHEICKDLRCARPVLSTIKSQHEHQDGSGYPEGLSGEAIPVGARVLGLANTFDVITSRDRLSPRKAVELLAAETEQGKWNRKVFEALESLYRDGRLEPRAAGL